MNPREISRVLLIRLREIGDVVFTTPAVRAIRERFPHAHLTYVVEAAAAPVVAGNPHLDEVIAIERVRGFAAIAHDAALIRRLRAARYDVAIDFHGGPRASMMAWLSGAPVRIGYEVAGRSWMYTTRVHRPRELRPRHSVENQWDLLAAIGIAPPDRAANPVEMADDPHHAESVSRRLAAAGVARGDELIVVHVSAGNPFRRWPASSFSTLVTRLAAAHPRRRLIVTSGPSEQHAADDVMREAREALGPAAANRIVSCGDLSLADLRALFERASLYIGGDSGPLHVASTTRVPVVGLYGPTLPARSAPWRDPAIPAESVDVAGLPCRPCDQRVCAPGDFRCLTRISPEEVLAAANRALARAADKMSAS